MVAAAVRVNEEEEDGRNSSSSDMRMGYSKDADAAFSSRLEFVGEDTRSLTVDEVSVVGAESGGLQSGLKAEGGIL